MTKAKPCYCAAYIDKNGKPWPHRIDSGKCRDFYNNSDISADYKAGMLRDFEKNEALSYNKELSIFEQVRF